MLVFAPQADTHKDLGYLSWDQPVSVAVAQGQSVDINVTVHNRLTWAG